MNASLLGLFASQQIERQAIERRHIFLRIADPNSELLLTYAAPLVRHALRQRLGFYVDLGVFYALEGMLVEAELEFQILADNNPQSPIAKRLLRIIES